MSNEFYYSLEDALEELRARQSEGFKAKVEKWWKSMGRTFPTLPELPNLAVLARQVATCRFEDILFRQTALRGGFTPAWLPKTADIFVSFSAYKRTIIRPERVVHRKENGFHTAIKKLVHPQHCERKPFRDILTRQGEPLIQWHAALRETVLGPTCVIGDIDDCPYPLFLSLFVAHAVLFEDYHGGESGDKLDTFATHRFEPAWMSVREEMGVTPIMVRMPWWNELKFYATDANWQRHGIV